MKYQRITRTKAIRLVEGAYLASTTGLIWIALYYLPIGGALFRLALPLPLALLQLRRGRRAGYDGLVLTILLLTALMGPIRGPLFLFPYGLLSFWLGWSWHKRVSWLWSWLIGVLIGASGFSVRVIILSILVGENLWIIITRAGVSLLDKIISLFPFTYSVGIFEVQFMAVLLVLIQELIYVLSLHVVALWIFPKLKSNIPHPPKFLNSLISLDSL